MPGSLARSLALSVLAGLLLVSVAWAQDTGSDLVVTKTGPSEAAADTDVAYTITLTNLGPEPAAGVTLTDAIPPGMTFVSETHDPAFSCSTPSVGFGGTVSCTTATLTASTSATFTFVFHISPSTSPGTTFVNAATSSSPTDPTDENNTSIAATTTPGSGGGGADMGVSKTGPATAAPDTNVVYTIVVTNAGPAAGSSVTLSDTLPVPMTFVSLSQSGIPLTCNALTPGLGGTLTCTAASYPAGGSTTLTLTVHIPSGTSSGTTFSNTATVSQSEASDPNPENNSSLTTLTVSDVDVSVTKTGPTTVNVGDNISYTLTVSNAGPDVATNVNLNDTLPPNTTFVSLTPNNAAAAAASCSTPPDGGTGTVTCTFDSLASGASANFTLVVRAGNTTSVTNTATVTTDSFDRDQSNNSASAVTSITPKADVGIAKAGPAAATPGADVTYTLTATNNGPSAAASVSITDTVVAPLTFVSLTQTTGPTFGCSTPAAGGTGTITCSIATLAPGASATFSLVLHLSPSAGSGSVSNTANISTSTSDPQSANNASTTTAALGPTADVSVTITGPNTGTPGSNVTYNVTVTNSGPSTATEVASRAIVPAATVTVTIVLSPNTTFVSLTQTAGPTFTCVTPAVGATGTITCTIATLAPGASATFSIVVNIPLNATGQITSTATVTTSTPDPNPANNASTVVINLEPAPPPAPTAIPTLSPSTFALLALGLGLAGFRVLRRRRPDRTR
jgi:uncharacterized repeat protein (TIGR01451 family)